MFNKKRNSNHVDTIIAQGTELTGDITFSGALFIDGAVQGNIKCFSDEGAVITLGVHGSIIGDIQAPNVVIFGQVTGDVHASSNAELKPGSLVSGNLHYKVIEMNAGAQVVGKMISLGETQALEHKESESSSESASLDDDSLASKA